MSTAADAVAPELLSWDAPVRLAGESRPPASGERGFVLRLHADAGCTLRLAPGTRLVERPYEQARADDLCPSCTARAVATSTSSAVRRLRDAERTLRRLLASAHDAPVPREIVHCRALRHEASVTTSVHPHVLVLASEVQDLASEVLEALREGLRRSLLPKVG